MPAGKDSVTFTKTVGDLAVTEAFFEGEYSDGFAFFSL
jgi:hypothetical protein